MFSQVISLSEACLPSHDFSILEFQGVGRARIGDAVDFGAVGEIMEDRMEIGIAKIAEIGDLHSETGEGVGHDGAVAAEFDELAHEFEVAAFARGAGQALGQSGDGGQARYRIRRFRACQRPAEFRRRSRRGRQRQ